MNKDIIFSCSISILLHAIFFSVSPKSSFLKTIDADVIKAPSSIEVSMAHLKPSFENKSSRSEKNPLPEMLKEKESSQNEKMTHSTIGAITEQISSHMTNVPPVYPRLARVKGMEGETILTVSIDREGKIANIDILSSSGFYLLDTAAVNAVRKWRFRHIDKAAQVTIPIKFVLTKTR